VVLPSPNATSLSLDIQNLPEVRYFGPPKQKKHLKTLNLRRYDWMYRVYIAYPIIHQGFLTSQGGFSPSSEPTTVFWVKLRSLEGKGS